MTPRPIQPADIPHIRALHRGVGWPARSAEGWCWLHAAPAGQGHVVGWVIDGPDGVPAAHVGNLVQRFHLGDGTMKGATGYSIIVSPEVRGAGRALIRAFARQPDVFATYTFNANARSQPLYRRHEMRPWPEPTHALKLSWAIDPVALAASRLLRAAYRIAPGALSAWPEQLLNRRLGAQARLDLPPGVSMLTDLRDTSRYADFWNALRQEPRLLADRGPAAVRWRLADPDATTPPLALAFNRGRDITGWALAQMAKANSLEAPVLEIIDLEALADDRDAIPTLMRGLLQAARAMGAAKLRLQTVSPALLDRLGPFAPSARREGGWGHCHVRFAEGAPNPTLWSPTPFDGDYSACLRPAPLGRRVAWRADLGAVAKA